MLSYGIGMQGTATSLVNTGQQLLATSRQLAPQLQQLSGMAETSAQLAVHAQRLKQLSERVIGGEWVEVGWGMQLGAGGGGSDKVTASNLAIGRPLAPQLQQLAGMADTAGQLAAHAQAMQQLSERRIGGECMMGWGVHSCRRVENCH